MRKLLVIALCSLPLFAQSTIPNNPGRKQTIVLRGGTIVPVTSAPIPNGTLIIENGKIKAFGAAGSVQMPTSAVVLDASGQFIYPGMIDSGTNVGLVEIDSVAGTVDTTELGDLNANAQAAIALNPHSELIPVTRVNGVTNVVSVPEGGIISGQSALIQMAGWTPKEMIVKAPLAMHIRFPRLRSAPLVDVPQDEEAEKELKKSYTKDVDKLRDILRDAQAYSRATSAKVKRVDRDLILEALVPVVEGRLPVIMHANLERDIRAAIQFADEFKLKMILAGAQDVARVIPELKSRNIPVLLGPILALPQREDDPYDLLFTNAKTLYDNGIKFAIQTTEAQNARNLPYHAGSCAAFGLPKDVALKAITIFPAEIFGVADQIGSIEVGKVANVIVTDGDPLEFRTNVKRVFIGGEEISTDSRHTLLYEKFKARP
jgi:imidazolonepropionase-like amidohydrolase